MTYTQLAPPPPGTSVAGPVPTHGLRRPRAARPSTVVVEDLRKDFGSFTAVDGMSFEVASGSVVGLLGPNGAGKTTMIRMLLGLTRPTSGRATVLGADLATPEFDAARVRVGAMIEGPSPYLALSGRRNVEVQAQVLGVPNAAARVSEVLELVDLADRQGDRAKGFSLGMKQRLGIAMALVANPELLILDEPANGLDPAGIVDLRNLLRRLAGEGITVLVSSHQLAEVQQASDHLVIMARGRVIEAGSTGNLLSAHQGPAAVEIDVPFDNLPRAASALASLGELTVDGTTVTVLPHHEISPGTLNQALFDVGVAADRIQRVTRSLEDVFLDLTADAATGGPTPPSQPNQTMEVSR
ncbi:ABC transporter ATP-binding protein [soil metagenome]